MERNRAATITVSVPAEHRFVAMTRVAAASLAAELDFDVDQIEELRIGVNELVSMLVERSPADTTLHLTYSIHADRLEVAGHNEHATSSAEPDIDDLARQILDVVVDAYHCDQTSFWLEKRGLVELT